MIDFNNGALFKLKKTSNDDINKQIEPLLISGEIIISTYKTIRDYVVFTSKRVIAINVQGITGAKKDYTSLPYSKIQAYSIETAGTFDLDSELEMYFSGLGKVKFDFKGSSDIIKIGQIISEFVL
ncbi:MULTISPECIES: PH domain-containing protein [Clostridium]|uniref:PH domain-containing protein n=1 Tax=Clostridium TaxID=1485 RepID=UPI0013FC4DD2|nr:MULTISPECIES: PH domain-containing protein [Clostridium]MBY6810263.1 PH domain-containing protein [Clostridium botulinum]MBY6823381.1 PH domain-containing protein [Clostridium botulinum]MBY6834123.1 PH domain-containing protein [Clostridium botulinum]MBY6972470.1 PH domain-containing protein [Clostridium botulinum]MCS6104543.1 PH domain-containing protein [Clostridium botulinum]